MRLETVEADVVKRRASLRQLRDRLSERWVEN